MADADLNIAELVEVIVRPLIDHEDDLAITETVDENGEVYIEISVHPDDAGKVIGRHGRIIKSIRTLARAAGSRAGIHHVDVELPD